MTVNRIYLLSILLTLAASQTFNEFEISKAEKVVTLNGQYPTEVSRIEYHCLLDQCQEKVYFMLREEYDMNIVRIIFGRDKNDVDSFSFSKKKYQHNGENYALYEITNERPFTQNQKFILRVQVIYINRYVNFPEEIDLSEDQKFEYEDNKYFLSPYMVKESSITYKFSKILSFDQDGEKKGLSGVLFKAAVTEPFNTQKHVVHGVNNEPQMVFTEVQRVIEVSHWGNIAIVENYKLKNAGPGLKGEFSRVQFSSQNNFEARNAWKGLQTNLPYEIWGLYYRDEVGNVTTSKALRDHHNAHVRFALVPRYALLGGWRVNYEIGYNLDTKGFLKHDGNKFELNKISTDYAFSKILAEKYTVKVILPEGATSVKLSVGGKEVDMNSVERGVNFGYLDFAGRTTYVIPNIRDIAPGQNLIVNYDLDNTAIIKKPLQIFGAIFSVLLLFVIIKRLNMSAFDDHRNVKQE